MKKCFFGALLLSLIMLFASCGANAKAIEISSDDYTALLYENSAGGNGDDVTARYTGERLEKMDRFVKENQSRKEETLFEKTWNISYDNSLKSDNLSYDMDVYSYVRGYDGVCVIYRMDTGRIVKYNTLPSPETFEGSSISPDSSEEAIVSYARSVLREITGETADGWDTRIESASFPYYRSDTMGPLFAEGYMVTFFKTIGGVERGDRMHVKMTNAGEIVEVYAVNYENAFFPFKDIQPDIKAIKQTAATAFAKAISCSHSEITDVALFVNDDLLWAQVSISFQIGEAYGGVSYVVEIAHLE